jgi:uncharacterized membrane protein
MRFRILSQKEFLAGLLFMAIGAGWGFASTRYQIGTATNMGAGYFPLVVSVALIVLGLCSVVRSLKVADPERIGAWPVRAMLSILLGIVAFALLLGHLGLVAASLALIGLSSYQRLFTRPLELAALATGVITLVVVLFVYALDLPFELF